MKSIPLGVLVLCFTSPTALAVAPVSTPALEITGAGQLRGHGLLKALEVDESFEAEKKPSGSDSHYDPEERTLKNSASGDWLFHVRTTSCHGDAFDNGTYTTLSRAFLPILFVLCTLAVAASAQGPAGGSKETDGAEATSGGGAEVDGERKRLWHLDFARICAVMCVVFEHSGGLNYTHRNVGFGLWWALPYLYMTSGMGSMMSKSGMWGYIARLILIFAIGVSANLVADIVTHRDWMHDFGNTIFQMFFVVMLLIMAPLAEPIRQALRWRVENPRSAAPSWVSAWTIFWGFASTLSLVLFCRGYTGGGPEDKVSHPFERAEVKAWLGFYAPVLRHSPIIVVHVGGTIFLSLLAACVTHPANFGKIGWVLLSFTYAQMVVIPWDQDSFPHLIALNIFAMIVTVWPLQGTETISKRVQSYWPFLLMFLCLDSMPEMWGRCDVHSPYLVWERFRFFLGEIILTVCFVTGSFAPDDPHKVTVWMGQWSLYAYCFHVMWYRLLGTPYGALVTFASIPVFWAMQLASNSGKSESKV